MTASIVLASASAVRARLLSSAGVPHTVAPSGVDERTVANSVGARGGRSVARELARRKALAQSSKESGACVIGCDQVLECDGEILGKPSVVSEARRQLMYLRGRTHVLCTAVCVSRHGDVIWTHVESPRLRMREFSESFLESYMMNAGDDLWSPGAYHLEGIGSSLFNRVDGDYFSILGIPLIPVLMFLRREGALPT